MRRIRIQDRLTAALIAGFIFVVLASCDPCLVVGQDRIESKDAPQASNQQIEQIKNLIGLLDADQYRIRKKASRDLAKIGLVALPLLHQAIVDGGPEVKLRSLESVKRIAKNDVTTNIFPVEAFLNKLVLNTNSIISTAASSTLAELQVEIRTLVFQHFNNKGAQINEVYQQVDGPIMDLSIGDKWTGTKEDMLLLRRCDQLRTLEVASDQVDEEVLEVICSLERLSTLELENAVLNNEAVEKFSKMASLNSLELRYVKIDDDSIDALEKLERLIHLGLIGTRISKDGEATLAETFADGRLDYRRGGFFGVRYNVGDGPCILTEVIAGTGAEKAGLQMGDHIISFNGQDVEGGDDFRNGVSQCFVGDLIEVEVMRDGEKIKMKATLGMWKM